MFIIKEAKNESKEVFYENLLLNVKGLIEGESDLIANLANIASLGYHLFENVNWFGFYLYKDNQLVLGPFHGKPACIRIDIGKGVCGKAAMDLQTVIVKNVHEFEGHIACDNETNSEIVVPIIVNDSLIGVLDIDSTKIDKFNEIDKRYLEELVKLLVLSIEI